MRLDFLQLNDLFDETYFTLNLTQVPSFNVSHERQFEHLKDIASLLYPFMDVTRRVSGPFSRDLTSRDDVLLALISLLILLIIESIIATLLLRRHHGHVSNFGFSVKQIIELIKDLNFRRIFFVRSVKHPTRGVKSAQPQQPRLSKLNIRLLTIAFSIFFLTLGLEVAVLFLTNEYQRPVSNATATFRVRQPVTPEFLNVFIHSRVSINRPCEAVTIENVHQASTGMNGCVDTDLDFTDITLFGPDSARGNVQLRIQSSLHHYGADHVVQIGDDKATYKQRTLFTLGDGRSRLMATNGVLRDEEEQMHTVHSQYVAHLFSIFNRAVAGVDPNVTLKLLRDLDFQFEPPSNGEKVDVLQLPGHQLQMPTRQYVTSVEGEIPRGSAALRVAQHFFRGMAAVVAVEGNTTDMFTDKGVDSAEAVVWEESVRTVNWLSMGVIAGIGLAALGVLRWSLNPASTAQIAGLSVDSKAVGGDGMILRSIDVEMGSENERYVLGAEVGGDEDEDEDGEAGGTLSGRSEYLTSE